MKPSASYDRTRRVAIFAAPGAFSLDVLTFSTSEVRMRAIEALARSATHWRSAPHTVTNMGLVAPFRTAMNVQRPRAADA